LGTARLESDAYTESMQLKSIQVFIPVLWLWVVLATIAGIAANVNVFLVWTVLTGVALLPPFVMLPWWHDPRRISFRRIQEARR
jgi:hypothetical protein